MFFLSRHHRHKFPICSYVAQLFLHLQQYCVIFYPLWVEIVYQNYCFVYHYVSFTFSTSLWLSSFDEVLCMQRTPFADVFPSSVQHTTLVLWTCRSFTWKHELTKHNFNVTYINKIHPCYYIRPKLHHMKWNIKLLSIGNIPLQNWHTYIVHCYYGLSYICQHCFTWRFLFLL